ncbi:MAG: peptidoglycan DD-metalloendopeptidase family protein [Gammaproteobacteria bacterium]|nr:peptidoglycan DD-metalloendopeptidase family protein [Gammaproteobacteria bacterium]
MMRVWAAAALIVLTLSGCAGYSGYAPVSGARGSAGQSDYYTVRPGDTLYSIAWDYGRDYKEVAQWNRIAPPYRIYAGQRLRLAPPANTVAKRSETSAKPKSKSEPATGQKTQAEPDVAPDDKEGDTPARLINWRWPAQGKLVENFGPRNKGINIAGEEGQAIQATAPGRVVYSGSGLVGLGQLLIIKHDNAFLSAYAHNKTLLVKEGDQVNAGQRIAEMGRTGAERVMLHFEIRKDGKPVDPLQYLPEAKL